MSLHILISEGTTALPGKLRTIHQPAQAREVIWAALVSVAACEVSQQQSNAHPSLQLLVRSSAFRSCGLSGN